MQDMSAPQAEARRRANFFAATRLDQASASPAREAREREAVAVIVANVVAQAGTQPTPAQLDHAAAIAQRFVRGLPLRNLHNMAAQSGLLADITNQCISAAAVQTNAAKAATPDTLTPDHHHQHAKGGDFLAALARRSERASSARYLDQLGGGTTAEQARIIEEARGVAIRAGIAWAANQPELLKLGPAAVQILADVHLKEQSYKRLTQEAHFAAKDVVTLADYAKEKGIKDANALANSTTNFVLLGDTPQRQQELKNAVTGYMKAATEHSRHPDNAEAAARHQAAEKVLKDDMAKEAAKSPEAKATVHKFAKDAHIEHLIVQANKAEANAEAKKKAADDAFGPPKAATDGQKEKVAPPAPKQPPAPSPTK